MKIYVNYTDRFLSRMKRWLPAGSENGSYVSIECRDMDAACKVESFIKNNKKDAKNIALSQKPRRKKGWDTAMHDPAWLGLREDGTREP